LFDIVNADRVATPRIFRDLNPAGALCAGGSDTVNKDTFSMTQGTVKWFNPAKGFGFINPDDGGNDAFVHISAVERAGLNSLAEGQRVSFELQPGKNGKTSAENLKLVD